MYLVAPAPEFGDDVPGKKARVAARDVQIDIAHARQSVQHRFKVVQQLHLVKQDVIHPFPADPLPDIRVQHVRIAESPGFIGIEGDLDDVVVRDARTGQMVAEQVEQQIRFPAPAQARDDLDQPVVLFRDQPVQVNRYSRTP